MLPDIDFLEKKYRVWRIIFSAAERIDINLVNFQKSKKNFADSTKNLNVVANAKNN